MKKTCMLSCILLSLVLSACTDGGTMSQTEQNTDATQAPETTAEDILEFLPEGIDYGGEEYSILDGQAVSFNAGENEVTYQLEDIETGDIIAEAVYERTRLAEEALNIKIVSESVAWDVLGETISKSVSSGDSSFEAIIGRLSVLSQAVPNGYLLDLNTIETLDLTNPWWDGQVNTSMTVGGKQCIASGAVNYYDDYSITCMAFNKKLFATNDIAEPYDLVREGKWTFDAFYEIVNDAAQDVNGDSKMDEYDFYGYVCNAGMMSSMMIAFEEEMTISDGSDGYILNNSASLIDKATHYAELMLNNDSVIVEERKLGYEKGDLLFPNGQALMTQMLVGSVVSYRQSMTDDFGVLPFPKYDISQENYHNMISQHWASSVSVPATCTNHEKVGYVLDTLGYFSPETVTEAVIEKNVMTKSTRDNDSADMLRLIFATKSFDTSIVFDWGVYNIWMDITMKTEPQIASMLERNAKSINKRIADSIEQIENMG
ncbi:MAG: extracellular solute-binding protein [Clostridia bacterium]|nr:extracellular solute-binding protein [Clostridia bacterium]